MINIISRRKMNIVEDMRIVIYKEIGDEMFNFVRDVIKN